MKLFGIDVSLHKDENMAPKERVMPKETQARKVTAVKKFSTDRDLHVEPVLETRIPPRHTVVNMERESREEIQVQGRESETDFEKGGE